MSTTKKVTKKEKFLMLAAVVEAAKDAGLAVDGPATMDELIDFANSEIGLLESKAASAQKRAEKKKAEGDELRETVFEALSDETFIPIDAIVAAVGKPDVTRNMVTSRLTQLIHLDRVEKDNISASDEEGSKARKIVAYRRKG